MFFNKSTKTYQSSSEWVSAGHPDRLADVLAAIVIDDIQHHDGFNSHAAIEVFITHDSVIFGGEATTTMPITSEYLRSVVQRGFTMCGYVKEMRKFWTKDQVLLASNMKIVNKVCPQSPDIALGTTDKKEDSGYNDCGVFFSSSDNTNSLYLGYPHYLAKQISDSLYFSSIKYTQKALGSGTPILGPDNKVVVTVNVAEDGMTPISLEAVSVAVAHSEGTSEEAVVAYVDEVIERVNTLNYSPTYKFIVNGTGRFVTMGPISDTSMTGRKISVNHPSAGPLWCNKMIGGGSMIKPHHASDLLLNVTARAIANACVMSELTTYAIVGLSCAIGQKAPQSLFIYGDKKFNKHASDVAANILKKFPLSPHALTEFYGLFDKNFSFASAVYSNFFGEPLLQPWENRGRLEPLVNSL